MRPGPRWALLAFPLAAILLCWDGLRPGDVLLPTALESLPPWRDAATAASLPRSNPLASDSLLLTLPARAYNHRMLREGRLPFWNPHVFCGYPHLALIQNGALYPPTLPLDFLDPLDSIDYGAVLHLTLAGFLMYTFLRRSGLDAGPALVGGLAFELNGFFLVRLSVPSYLYSGTWLPLMLLGAQAVTEGGPSRARWALPAGVALSIAGGHPQITVLAVLLAAAWAEGRLWLAPAAAGASRLRTLANVGLLVLLGAGLAGFALVPFAELLAHSARDAVPLDVYRRSAAPIAALAQALLPDVFGHPVDGTYWFGERATLLDGVPAHQRYWGFNAIGQNLFTGVAPLALAVLAVRRRRARPDVALFAGIALASLAVFLRTPLVDLAWAVVPGFRYSRPDRVVFVYMAAVSILAAHGADALRGADTPSQRVGRGGRFWLAIAAVLLAWAVVTPLVRPDGFTSLAQWLSLAAASWRAQQAHLSIQAATAVVAIAAVAWLARRRSAGPAAIALLAVLAAAPSLAFGWRFNPAQRAPELGRTAVEKTLQARSGATRLARVLPAEDLYLPPNLTQLLGLDDVQGASAAGLEPYIRLVQAADPAAVVGGKYFLAFRDRHAADSPLLRLLAVEWVLSDAAGAITLSRLPGALPRFYVVPRAEPYDDVAQARARLLSPAFDPRASALVPVAQAATLAAGSGTGGADTSVVTVQQYEPHRIELDVDAPVGGLLVSSEAAYPGWRSEVDGRTAETLLVNTAFRGVAVPPGRHRVTMEYVPWSFAAGLALSGAALMVTLLARARRG